MIMKLAPQILLVIVAVSAMFGYMAFAKGGSIGIYAIVDKVVLEPAPQTLATLTRESGFSRTQPTSQDACPLK
jgi:hypothetical protein